MTEKVNDYITNEIILTAKKSVPFIPNDLVNSFPLLNMPPFEDNNSVEAHAYAYISIQQNIDRQINILLKEGYIKRLLDNNKDYILSEKGEKAQDLGSITKYKKKQQRKKVRKKYTLYMGILLPLITIASLILAILSYFKKTNTFTTNKIEVKIDSSLLKNRITDSYNPGKLEKQDTSITNPVTK